MTPEENPFSFMTIEEIKGMMGTKLMSMPEIAPKFSASALSEDLPDAYDFKDDHADCLHAIRDQARCGSCWAFGATEALSDRFCKAGVDVILSPEDLVECEKDQYACNGGYLNLAWSYMEKTGVVTDECYAYHSGDGHVEGCHAKCDSDSETFDKYHCAKGSIVHPTKTDDIKREILNNGPMEIAFTVYEDFMSYKTGVYQHKTGSMLGGHAVKVTGWGIEDGVEFWHCANSWNSSWGEDGFFKIKIGDCASNNQLYACTPEQR
jgi:cathepsin B